MTSRTIKNEFKSSKKNEPKERKQIAARSLPSSLLLTWLCLCFCLPCCNAALVETPHFNSTERLCAPCASYPRPFGPPFNFSDRDSLAMAMKQENVNDKVQTPVAGFSGHCFQIFSFPMGCLPIGTCSPSLVDPVGLPAWPCPEVGENDAVSELFWWPDVCSLGWRSRSSYFGVLGCLAGAWLFCFFSVPTRSTTRRVRAKARQRQDTTRSPTWLRAGSLDSERAVFKGSR